MTTLRTLSILIIIGLTLIQDKASGQDTIWVKEGNKKYMVQGHREWLFKDNLPDGHYCSYDYGYKKFPLVEISFVNGKKEGIENRYYSSNKEKHVVINWQKGKKNGIETCPLVILEIQRIKK